MTASTEPAGSGPQAPDGRAAAAAALERRRALDRRLVGRAGERGQLTAAQAQAVLETLERDQAAGGERTLREVLEEHEVPAAVVDQVDRAHALEGETIGGFRLIEAIGVGGVGFVFLAEQTSLSRIVAVKVLDPLLAAIPQVLERFIREARTAARLTHPHVVTPIDFGEEEGLYYFAMEYMEGGTAAAHLEERGPYGERDALLLVRSVAKALVYGEEQGILHRDIKPDNILFDRHGTPRLGDLGLVLDLKGADPKLTLRGMVMGSPHYMAPEQATSQRRIDARSDIYALGVTLFELLAGEPPFRGTSGPAILAQHVSRPLPDLRERGVSDAVADLVEHMCEKDPIERPQAARVVVVAIDEILEELGLEPAPPDDGSSLSGERRTRSRASRGRAPSRGPTWRLAALGLLLAALAAGLAYAWLAGPRIDPEAEAEGVEALERLLLSYRGPSGGYRDGLGRDLDPWVTSEALLALVLLEDPKEREHLNVLVERLPGLALDGSARGGPPGFAGFAYNPQRDNAACIESTASVGLALALAKGRVDSDPLVLGRPLFEYLLSVQAADGSFATVAVAGPEGAMTGATVIAATALCALGIALDERERAYVAAERAARWLCSVFDDDGAFFEVNPRRRWGGDRSIPGLNEEAVLALLDVRGLAEGLGRTPSPLVQRTIDRYAEAFRPSKLPPEHVAVTRLSDYEFPSLGRDVLATAFDDRWVVYPYRLQLAFALARQEDAPRREAWHGELLRLRAEVPSLAERFDGRPAWQVAEALLGAAFLRAVERTEGRARTLCDLVKR